ncbi:MAG TPA: glycosyltransferase, partial [Acidimicrobiia bacterium]
NRHVRYLEANGIPASLITDESGKQAGRLRRIFRCVGALWKEKPDVVILPDPELFVLGSLAARLRGVRPIIDIHENYSKAVASREWIPGWLKPLGRLLAGTNTRMARKLASEVIVAADELSFPGAVVVLNVPDPADFEVVPPDMVHPTAVYVGDVTEARGALEIAELASRLPDIEFLVIGRVGPNLAAEMVEIAGQNSSLTLVGRKSHGEAWEMASGSIAGLSLLRPLPAYLEATATKLWEYSAAGIPPVVTNLPGQKRFVASIHPGLAGGTIDDIETILLRLCKDPEFRNGASVAAREAAVAAWESARPDQALVRVVSPGR